MKPDKFTDKRHIILSEDCKSFTIIRSFEYYRKDRKEPSIIVPEGFESDGFSSGIFSFLLPNVSRSYSAACCHDVLCERFHKGLNTRKYADDIFLECLLETKVCGKFRAKILYLAVRLFAKFKGYK